MGQIALTGPSDNKQFFFFKLCPQPNALYLSDAATETRKETPWRWAAAAIPSRGYKYVWRVSL